MPGTSPVPSAMVRAAFAPVARRASPPRAMASLAAPAGRAAWVPEDPAALRRMATRAVEADLAQHYQDSAKAVVGWFTGHMPASYFREVSMPSGIAHLRSLAATPNDITVRDPQVTADLGNGVTELSFMKRADTVNAAETVVQLLDELPEEIRAQLHRVKVFTSTDDKLQIFAFTYGPLQEGSASLEQYLEHFNPENEGDAGAEMPLQLRFPNSENIHHFVNLRHRQCRLEGGPLVSEHHSIFLERRGYSDEAGHKMGKFRFYCAFTGWAPFALARKVATKVAEDGFALRAFHLDLVTGTVNGEEMASSMLHMEAVSPVDHRGDGNSLASWKSAQHLRWRLQTSLLRERMEAKRGFVADFLEEVEVAEAMAA